jgi:hypothetical protein
MMKKLSGSHQYVEIDSRILFSHLLTSFNFTFCKGACHILLFLQLKTKKSNS